MESWIHLFSKFTSEALLFEALGICFLVAAYAAFWVLRKRRFGSMQEQVPSGVVKIYLGQLINEANLIRTQLFGLLNDAGALPEGFQIQMTQAAPLAQATAAIPQAPETNLSEEEMKAAAEKIANDPALAAKLAELQKKLDEQVVSTETVVKEKKAIEDELAKLKAEGGAAPSGDDGGGDSNELAELRKKIKELEDRLAEYSVIEDDLANLKRLQQENSELKAKLGGSGGEAPAAEAEAPSGDDQDPPAPEAAPSENSEVKANDAPPEEAKADEAPKEGDPGFENLVDQVEDSLKTEEAPKEQEPAAEAPKEEAAPAAEETPQEEAPKEEVASADAPAGAEPVKEEKKKEEKAPIEEAGKSDDDLLSEFEKMLNM